MIVRNNAKDKKFETFGLFVWFVRFVVKFFL
jgi:hypothetical protein